MLWLGVDVGTTHVKAVVYQDGSGVVATAIEPTPVEVRGETASRRPIEVAETVLGLVRQAVAAVPGGGEVGGIAVASVGEEIVPVDRHGLPVCDIPVWYDPRGLDEARAFATTDLHRRFPPDPTSSLFKLLWLAANRDAVLERAAHIVDLSSFVLTRLGAAPVMDWSHASRTALFDPASVAWDQETVGAARLPESALPELVPSGTVVGRLEPDPAAALGLEPGAPLVSGGHDHFVGAFASGVREVGDLYLSAGTSEAQLVLGDGALLPLGRGGRIDQGRYVDDRHWYAHRAAPCGQVYAQWRDLLFRGDPGAIDGEVRGAPESGGLRLEIDEDRRIVSLLDVPITASRGAVMRAVEEGSAMATNRVFRALERASNRPIRRIVMAGHPVSNPRWLALRMRLLGRAVDVVSEPEVAALGAAFLARRGVTGEPAPPAATTTYRLGPDGVPVKTELLAKFGFDGDTQRRQSTGDA